MADGAETQTNPRGKPLITLHLTAAMWKMTSILSLYNDAILLQLHKARDISLPFPSLRMCLCVCRSPEVTNPDCL